MDFQIFSENEVFPNIMRIGEYDLYTPTQYARSALRQESEEHLRSKYQPGIYSGKCANEISQFLFAFYESQLKQEISNLDNDYFIYFTLYQYDVAARINCLFKSKKLNKQDQDYWLEKGALYRRTFSYMLDTMISNFTYPSQSISLLLKSFKHFDRFFLLSEKAINYSIISNEIFYLNDSYRVRINPIDSDYFLESLETKESKKYSRAHKYYMTQSTKDIALRDKYTIGKPYETDWIKHGKFLNDSFKQVFGLTYHELMFILTDLIKNTKPINDEKDIPLVQKDNFINDILSQVDISKEQINHFFDGLILNKERLSSNKRTFTKFKQTYRVGKRPFLEIKKQGQTYLSWSTEMLKERLNLLDNDFIFKTIPPEWNDNLISKAVSKISNDAGTWFENQLRDNLNFLGFKGGHIKDKISHIKNSMNSICIGGFDYLGYDPKDDLLILIECKFINPGFEPRSYYDDVKSFIDSKHGYVKDLDNKVQWLIENFSAIKRELSIRLKTNIPDTCNKIGAAFITYVKTFAFAFIDKYPCVSFTEFLENYNKRHNWYFKYGLFEINRPAHNRSV